MSKPATEPADRMWAMLDELHKVAMVARAGARILGVEDDKAVAMQILRDHIDTYPWMQDVIRTFWEEFDLYGELRKDPDDPASYFNH